MFQHLKGILRNFTDLRFASKALAAIISTIALAVLGMVAFLYLFGFFFWASSQAYFLVFMLVGGAVFLAFIMIGQLVAPILWQQTTMWISGSTGRGSIICGVGLSWFSLFLFWIYSTNGIQVEAAITTILTSCLMLIYLSTLVVSIRGRAQIAASVGGFLCILVLYGGVYNLSYLLKPSSFSFSDSIAEGIEIKERNSSDMAHLGDLQLRSYVLHLILDNPELSYHSISRPFEKGGEWHEVTSFLSMKFEPVPDPPDGDELYMFIRYHDLEFAINSRNGVVQHPEHEQVAGFWRNMAIDEYRLQLEELLGTQEERKSALLLRLEASAQGNHPWAWVDFMYFSAVTRTTLGYGDILPNSSLARLFVMSQAVIVIVYIGFILAFIRNSEEA